MKRVNYKSAILLSFLTLAVFFLGLSAVRAVQVNTSETVNITAEVNSAGGTGTSTPPGGGGGGSSAPAPTTTSTLPATVNFSGMAYPSSKVVILQDGAVVVNTVADPNANFSASVTGLAPGTYTFAVYAVDSSSNHSASFSFPVYVTAGATINIGGVILAPTIGVQKSEVKQGDNEPIFGFTVPDSQVNIAVHSDVAHMVSTVATSTGAYLYNFDTTPLELGTHNAQSRSIIGPKVSADTDPISFIVGDQNINSAPSGCGTIIGDINCDGKVNLVDFSILAYWYKKGGTPPANVDLNGDGVINLIDFSILAYHWTG